MDEHDYWHRNGTVQEACFGWMRESPLTPVPRLKLSVKFSGNVEEICKT